MAPSEELHLLEKQRKLKFLSHFAFKTRNGLRPSTEVFSLQRKGGDEFSKELRADFEQQEVAELSQPCCDGVGKT